jgi:hypothetical protein
MILKIPSIFNQPFNFPRSEARGLLRVDIEPHFGPHPKRMESAAVEVSKPQKGGVGIF